MPFFPACQAVNYRARQIFPDRNAEGLGTGLAGSSWGRSRCLCREAMVRSDLGDPRALQDLSVQHSSSAIVRPIFHRSEHQQVIVYVAYQSSH